MNVVNATRDGGRSASLRLPGLSAAAVFHAIGLLGAAWLMLRAQVDPDAWWHLRVAQNIISTGALPTSDFLSWWAFGTPWISPSWANELLLYVANSVAGPAGQSLVYLPVFLAIAVLMDRSMALLDPSLKAPARLVAIALTAIALSPVLSPRAGNFDLLFVLFGVYGWLRYRSTGSSRLLWLMPIAGVAWANLHGGGVMVYVLLAFAFGVGTYLDRARYPAFRWRYFIASVALTYLALGLNGYGPALYLYPWSTVLSSAQTDAILEWRSPDLATPAMFLFRSLVAFGLLLGLSRARMTDAAGAFISAGMLFLALGSTRYLLLAIPLLAVWYVPALYRAVPRYIPRLRRRNATREPRSSARAHNRTAFTVAAAVAAIAIILSVNILPDRQELTFEQRYPTATLAMIEGCPIDRLWTDYGFGGWTSYRTGRLIGPYGAADSLGDERLSTAAAVERLTTDPGAVFDALAVDAVITALNGPLAHWLTANPSWRVLGSDQASTAAVRAGLTCQGA